MGIFDIFKSKKKEPNVGQVPPKPAPTPMESVASTKKPGRKKKDSVSISEGLVKKGGLVNPSAAAVSKRPKAPPGQTPVKKATKKTAITEGTKRQNVKTQSDSAKPAKPAPVKKKASKKSDYQTTLEKAKEEATAKGEPWVSVLSVELDMDNLSNGSFNLDWNDFFLAKLVRAGYKGTDEEIVDQWFSQICRNVLAENFEQEQADPTNRFRE